MPQSLVPASLPVTCNVQDSKATAVDVRQIPLKLPCLWMHHLSIELEGTLLFQGFLEQWNWQSFGTRSISKGQGGKITNSIQNQIGRIDAFLFCFMVMGQSSKTMTACSPYPSKGCWTQLMISRRICGLRAYLKGLALQEGLTWKALAQLYGSGYHGRWRLCSTTNVLQTLGDMIYWILRLFSVRLDRTFFLMDISVYWLASWVTWNFSKMSWVSAIKAVTILATFVNARGMTSHGMIFQPKQLGEQPRRMAPRRAWNTHCSNYLEWLLTLHVWMFCMSWTWASHSHCLGNIIFDLVINILPGSRQQNLKEVWTFIQTNQRETEHGKQLSHFTLLHFCNPNKLFKTYRQMHHLKAAQCRMLVPVVHQLKTLMFNLDMWSNFVYAEPMVPNFERAKEAVGYMNKALQCYQWLAAGAFDKGKCMWSMVPKHHYSAEMAYQGLYLNPRFVWTYGSEDYVGKLSDLGASYREARLQPRGMWSTSVELAEATSREDGCAGIVCPVSWSSQHTRKWRNRQLTLRTTHQINASL